MEDTLLAEITEHTYKLEQLWMLFAKNGLPKPTNVIATNGKYQFSLFGARDSIIIYWVQINSNGAYISAWAGKREDDSGGLAFSSEIINSGLDYTLRLHSRFLFSGRRKILRRFEDKRLGR